MARLFYAMPETQVYAGFIRGPFKVQLLWHRLARVRFLLISQYLVWQFMKRHPPPANKTGGGFAVFIRRFLYKVPALFDSRW